MPKDAAKINREYLGLAAEYAVASELCRRGLYAQLTLGNHKKTDLLVEETASDAMLAIQFKAKQKTYWPACRGIYGRMFLVFVDFKDKRAHERPDFYILDANDWKRFLDIQLGQKLRQHRVTTDEHLMPTFADGFRGTHVGTKMIVEHKERWDKIEKLCKSKPLARAAAARA